MICIPREPHSTLGPKIVYPDSGFRGFVNPSAIFKIHDSVLHDALYTSMLLAWSNFVNDRSKKVKE